MRSNFANTPQKHKQQNQIGYAKCPHTLLSGAKYMLLF